MQRTYEYSCMNCGDLWEFSHRHDEDATAFCQCGGVMHRVPQSPRIISKGSRFVNGERKIAPFTTLNRDGSDVTYTSLRQAQQGELDRGVHPRAVKQNLEYLHKRGYVPGTWQHDFKEACAANPLAR